MRKDGLDKPVDLDYIARKLRTIEFSLITAVDSFQRLEAYLHEILGKDVDEEVYYQDYILGKDVIDET